MIALWHAVWLSCAIVALAVVGFGWWFARELHIADRKDEFLYWDDEP